MEKNIDIQSASADLIKGRINYLWEKTDFANTLFRSLTGYAIIAADFDGNILAYNEGARHIYGYELEKIIGKQNIDIFFSEAFIKSDGLQQIINGLMNKETISYEGEKVREDGGRFPARILFSVTRDIEGKLVGFVEIVEDITKQKEAEKKINDLNKVLKQKTIELKDANMELETANRELKQKSREAEEAKSQAEAANKAKSDFLANMSHELRTPLSAVIGFSEVLHDELFGPLNDKQKEYINDIIGSGIHLLNLINDILDLSKVEADKLELELSTFLLKDIICISLSMLKEKAMKHEIRLGMEIEPEADIELEADERKLKQIMFNLLSNAVKFTPDGGSVSVAARRGSRVKGQGEEKPPTLTKGGIEVGVVSELAACDLTLDPDRDFIEISIVDTGIGIKPEDMDKLFKEFSQIENVYTKTREGTGLGLALSKRLVDIHGGRIWVESEFGKGSKFTFVIPVVSSKGQRNGKDNIS